MGQDNRLFSLFADVLEYPAQTLGRRVGSCAGLLAACCPPASEIFSTFQRWEKQQPLERLEELYTQTFDLQGVCCPYIGHHLFGDNYKRSWFMAQLNEGYRAKGFSSGNELPDHIAVVLRFLALGTDDEFSRVLLEEGLTPAVGKMVESFGEDGSHPYGQVLAALYALLNSDNRRVTERMSDAELGGLSHG